MTLWRPSRRALLKTSAISAAAALIGAPRIVRPIQRRWWSAVLPARRNISTPTSSRSIEKKLGIKVIYEGTNSLTNLQKMTR